MTDSPKTIYAWTVISEDGNLQAWREYDETCHKDLSDVGYQS